MKIMYFRVKYEKFRNFFPPLLAQGFVCFPLKFLAHVTYFAPYARNSVLFRPHIY